MKTEEFDKLIRGLSLMQQYNKHHIEHLESNYKTIHDVTKGVGMNDVGTCSSVALIQLKGMIELNKIINRDFEMFKEELKKGTIKFEENGKK